MPVESTAKPRQTTEILLRNKRYQNQETMKRASTLYTLIASACMMLAVSNAHAQSAEPMTPPAGTAGLKKDTANTFISFSPVYLDGKTYVRWLVKNDKKDGVFVVERSEDGIDFEALGFKDRVGTQLLVNLFYSFVDEEPLPGDNHYRIMQVGADNTYRYSSVVKVKNTGMPVRSGSSANAEEEKK